MPKMTSDWSRGGAQKGGWLGDGEGGTGAMQVVKMSNIAP